MTTRLEKQVGEIHRRVFNGLGKEIRAEVDKEISHLRNLVIGILVSVLLAMTGIVIEGRFSDARSSEENMRNYKAILEVSDKLDDHIQASGLGK